MGKKISKNLQKVQDQLDGTYKGKIQVSMVDDVSVHANRKVGDKWFDSEGDQWEQMDGYRSKVSRVNVGMFPHQCKDCKANCDTNKLDKDTYMRMDRCYYCQIDFESMLKSRVIGKTNNKHYFWTRLLELQRWISGRRELEQWVEEQHKENQGKLYDMSVANAMANANVDMSIKKNT